MIALSYGIGVVDALRLGYRCIRRGTSPKRVGTIHVVLMMQRTRTTGPACDLSPALVLHLLPIQLLLFLADFGVLGRL